MGAAKKIRYRIGLLSLGPAHEQLSDSSCCRSRAPTARLKLKGITTEIYIQSEEVKYIVLKKKTRTKLVLSADSPTEFDGWLKTLDIEIKRQDELHSEQNEQIISVNAELTDPPERGRGEIKVKAKTPVPTPRTRTPSRETVRETAREMVGTRTEEIKESSSSDEQHSGERDSWVS